MREILLFRDGSPCNLMHLEGLIGFLGAFFWRGVFICLNKLCACEGNKLLSVLLQEGDNVRNHKPNRLSGYELVSYTCLPEKKFSKLF